MSKTFTVKALQNGAGDCKKFLLIENIRPTAIFQRSRNKLILTLNS